MLKSLLSLTLSFLVLIASAQTPRQLPAKRTTASFKIDGELSEAAWKEAAPATSFIEWRPNAGKPENPATGTEVYILYSNTSIYIGGFCHERTRDSVSRELVGRDVVGVNDFVGVIFDTYNDKINALGFYVTPYGEQFDAKYSNTNGEDGSWSGVWNSASKIRNDGWTFEMEIPYSALRFVSKPDQTWGINITRRRNKTGQQYMWNPIDPQKNGFVNQEGEWTGIEKIEPPLRLSLSPYLGVYANHFPQTDPKKKNWNTSVTGGMDVKWGVSDAFTLDMTLIPDFGQVRSDNTILNLSPFEVRYQEQRPFFTEGTELFNKGNLFYSRRIGLDPPLHMGAAYNRAAELRGEVIDNPAQAKLINATKFSGRTRKGLGIGVFNAVQRTMYATVADSTGKNRERVETGPLTNYNVLVFDQTMKNNSSVSFINTNVLRDGSDPDANVSAFLFDVNNKKNTYNWNGNVSVSNIFSGGKTSTGYAHFLAFGKTGGRFNFNIAQELYDEKYDKTDLGFMNNNNYLDHSMWMGYKWTQPKGIFNNLYLNFNQGLSRRFNPSAYQQYWVNVNGNGQLKNLWYAGVYVGYNADGHDFYEPRLIYAEQQRYTQPGAPYFVAQSKLMTNAWIETNNAKKYKVNINAGVDFNEQFNGRRYDFSIYQRYRFSDKLSMDLNVYYNPWIDNAGFYGFYVPGNGYQGYYGSGYTDVLFSRRNRNTIENTFSVKYSFSNRSFINIRARHYWSDVEVKDFYDLQPDGTLLPTKHNDVPRQHQNFNIFNVDAQYTLQFAPGSFLNIVWKNQALDVLDPDYTSKYGRNLSRTLDAPASNNLSVKVIWYLDYLQFRKWTGKGK
ncbi:DUF5916 domain-containing protein [Flaviaesturariibacter aridisoli]|uniref:DUF5916 domain-containing protein n=1 Tax=Flaviaesturariibacter aridisoli TaxID=2545761 RepID=A0A4R4E4N5_9BACT|nr:DUF5916 domain-containing protein [Flaviaesturariibacter aridisoli]TCZ74574.1 hypothetical protein E0486_02805 [Flaviaesturariibacter aridisoli]